MQATTENYKQKIKQHSYLIGKILKPKNLPLLYLVATDWSIHGSAQETWLKNNHSLKDTDWLILSDEELKQKIVELENLQWPEQFLEIQAFFRDENNGRVFFGPLEYILFQNRDSIDSLNF